MAGEGKKKGCQSTLEVLPLHRGKMALSGRFCFGSDPNTRKKGDRGLERLFDGLSGGFRGFIVVVFPQQKISIIYMFHA